MACDLCGAKGTPLIELLSSYKTKEVQQICPDCEKAVNKHLWKVKDVTNNILLSLMRRYFAERAKEINHAE